MKLVDFHEAFMYSLNPVRAWKSGGNDRFVTVSFPSLIKDGNDNSFPHIHIHNTNAFFFEDLTGKHFYNLVCKLYFLHTDLPTLHKRACFPQQSAIIDLSRMFSYASYIKKLTTQLFSTECVSQLSTKQLYQRINHCILVINIFTCMLYF